MIDSRGKMAYRGVQRRDGLDFPEQSSDRNGFTVGDGRHVHADHAGAATGRHPSMSLNDLEQSGRAGVPPVGWLDDSPTGSLATTHCCAVCY